jgi:threonine dehydrogenase-like Zn-dependent dehydrogenase
MPRRQNLARGDRRPGVDVVFEVSGFQAGVDLMTEVAAARGRIVIVAIHAKKPIVDLFRFFFLREIEMLARAYEAEDYEKAIALIAGVELEFGA